jgi:hypothetical protein
MLLTRAFNLWGGTAQEEYTVVDGEMGKELLGESNVGVSGACMYAP